MWNLRLSMILYGLIQMAEGIVMWIRPDLVYTAIGFDKYPNEFPTNMPIATNFVGYILALMGAALIAGGFLFLVASVNPAKNINAVRFAVLWAALALIGQIYTITKGYVTFGDIWSNLIITGVFLIAFIFFFPWPWRRQSYK